MKQINFPKSTGLNPRPASNYDLLVIRYARAIKSNNRRLIVICENELKTFGSTLDDLDTDYSNGLTLLKCELTPIN